MLILEQCGSDSIMTTRRGHGGGGEGAEEVPLGSLETEIYGNAILLLLLAVLSPSWLAPQAAAKFLFHFDKRKARFN